ncbi:MAG TPA: apolipoprotein N-acyltransferase [Vicinamibacterales bacterium]|nr:apolipoprotein N-acyltransferase [Vicinamibacterales bacterium]
MLALSFPKYGHPAFGWIALAPLLVVAWDCGRRRLARRAFLLGWIAGVAYFAGSLYWLVRVMTVYGGLNGAVAVLVAALLMAYLALFPAISTWAIAFACGAHGARGLMLAPAAWVTGELGRTYVWSGFPWVLLGYSQVTVLPIAQSASLVGVYGLSMLLAYTAAAAAYALVGARRRFVPAIVAVLLVAVLAIWGAARVGDAALTREGTPIRVAVVQGNISQDEKWDPALRDAIMKRYVDLSRSALAADAQFVLWPESSLPFYFEQEPPGAEPIRRLAREGRAAFLVGSDQVEQVRLVPGARRDAPRERYYNAAFLVLPDGRTGGVYRKMHLVPFGEYVPLKDLLFFVAPLVEAVSDFSPGDTPALLSVAGHRSSTAICYEVVYPRLIAGFVDRGSELLTTITNDAWFGESSAAYQHFDQAAMRAIEQGRYLARAANTGISGFVDPYGRVLDRTELFEPAVRARDLRFLTGRTVYGRVGDVIAYAGLVITGIMIGAGLRFFR